MFFTQIPNDLLDSIMRMKGRNARVMLALSRLTYGFHRQNVSISLRKISEMTGIDRSDCRKIVDELKRQGYISVELEITYNITVRGLSRILCIHFFFKEEVCHLE